MRGKKLRDVWDTEDSWGAQGDRGDSWGHQGGPRWYLGEGQAPGELLAQHDHTCHPEEEEVASRLQHVCGVETLQVRGLGTEVGGGHRVGDTVPCLL